MTRKLSVFFPVFNEEGNVKNTVDKAIIVLEKFKIEYEILVVNDGSTDNTAKVLEGLTENNKKIRVINHEKNLGYGEALKSGFYNARYDTIVYTDGDGQFDFSEVTKFLEKIEDYDLIIGYRIKRQDSILRRIFGKGWRLTLFTFFGLRLKDVDCGFKMISKKVLEKIPHLESQRGAMINAELAIKTKKYGFKVGQIGVNHYPRLSGRPTGANLKVIFKSYLDLLKLWWKLKDQKWALALLIGILVLAAFLRFYKLEEYMTFLGDEGRDAIVIKDMLVNHHFPLIGPPSSVGNIYLGPLYYYMMAVPMFIFYLNPVAAAGMDALLGVLTVFFIYYFGKKWFNRQAGLLAAYLYAISSVVINYSRFSWNPNPTPFFALLAVFGLFKAHESRNYKWLILMGIGVGAAVQMHYLALILLPVLFVGWLKELFTKSSNLKSKFFWRGTILAIIAFVLMLSPLIIFDFRHNFQNYRAFNTIFFVSDSTINSNLLDMLKHVIPIYSHDLVGRYITAENSFLTPLISILVLIPLLWTGYLMYKKRQYNYGLWVMNNWLLIGIVGLAFYKQNIYDHYLGFLNPVPFLLFGSVILLIADISIKKRWLINCALIVLIIFLTIVNLQRNPLLNKPNNQLKRTQNVAKFVIDKAGGRDFNFALIAKSNYDSAYQFYLDLYGYKPKQVPFDKTEQLFVVCEDEVCDPTHNPKYEVAAFGMSKIDWQQDLEGLKIYKLIPNPGGKPN